MNLSSELPNSDENASNSSSESSGSDGNASKTKRRRYNAGMFKNYEIHHRKKYKDPRFRYKWDSFGRNNENTFVTVKYILYKKSFDCL